MYSAKKNILQLVSLMQGAGFTDVVVCPGSRNAPLVHTFNAAGMNCYEITDERSAGFFALGLIEAKGKPVAVCCTSGSAVSNLAPAVAEAFYRPLPLIVITADRPMRWIGQMDGQTLPQTAVFGDTVRKVVSLPEPESNEGKIGAEEEWHSNRLINEAFIALRKFGGPVQINVPITEPLFDFTAERLPSERLVRYESPVRSVSRLAEAADMRRECLEAKRPMIVVGQMSRTMAGRLREPVSRLVRNGAVVFADRLSNLQVPGVISYVYDSLLYAERGCEGLKPDFVVTLGGHIVSKRLKLLLRNGRPKVHWHVDPNGELADLFCCATRLVEATGAEALEFLQENVVNADKAFGDLWRARTRFVDEHFGGYDDWGYSDMSVLKAVVRRKPSAMSMQVANSSVVRNVQLFDFPTDDFQCNRGVNGIDGCVSTAVGYMAAGRDTLFLTGDLTFFYDRNGLWNRFVKETGEDDRGGRLRIVILNNGGGQIFRMLNGLGDSPYRDRYVAASHDTSAEFVAREIAADYFSVRDAGSLERSVDALFRSDKKVAILEAFTDPAVNESAVRDYYSSMKKFMGEHDK